MARLDLFLKHTGLVKQRSQAKQACDQDCIRVDGKPAKSSRPVKAGEIITIDFAGRHVEAEIVDIPIRHAPKSQRDRYVKILRQEIAEPDDYLTF